MYELVIFFSVLLSTLLTISSPKGGGTVKTFSTVANSKSDSSFSLMANGKRIFVEKYKTYHYSHFEATSSVSLDLSSAEAITSLNISPSRLKIMSKITRQNASFTVPKPGYYVVRVNQKHKLFLFVDPPEDKKVKNILNVLSLGIDNTGRRVETSAIQTAIDSIYMIGKTLFFPAGIYKTGSLFIPGNVKIYLAAGAVLKGTDDLSLFDNSSKPRGFIIIKNANGAEISGRGTIDANGRYLRDKFGDDARMRLLLILNSKNIKISGITIRDPGSWNTQILKSENVTIRNVKMLNDVELSNTDGFDPDASKHVLIENCFAYCGDDNVAIKTSNTSGYLQDVEGITVRGCVFLTRKSSLKVGTETRGIKMKNILFEDNDVVESDRGMALYCSDGAVFENIRYINNRFEDNYPDAKRCGIHFTINKRNADSRAGQMTQVLIKNCSFDKPFPKSSEIAGFDSTHRIGVTIENLTIGGKSCKTSSDANINANGFADVLFK